MMSDTKFAPAHPKIPGKPKNKPSTGPSADAGRICTTSLNCGTAIKASTTSKYRAKQAAKITAVLRKETAGVPSFRRPMQGREDTPLRISMLLIGISFNGKSHEAFHQHKRNALAPKTIPDFIRKGDDGYVRVKFCGKSRPEAWLAFFKNSTRTKSPCTHNVQRACRPLQQRTACDRTKIRQILSSTKCSTC